MQPGAQPAELNPFPGARIGVVIPCYRVARQIERVVAGIPPWIEAILCVEDKSPDDTLAVLERLRDPRVRVLRHDENGGVGAAVQTGFDAARALGLHIVVKMDGDDQMDPAHLPRLVAPLYEGRADMTKGNRWGDGTALRQMPLVRIVGNTGLTFLVKFASGHWSLFDPANGYLALRTEVLGMLRRRLPARYFFESGLLIELGIVGGVVQDVSIPARYGDEHSSLSIPRALLGFPPRLLHGFLRRVLWRYFLYDFGAVSVFVLLGVPLLLCGSGYGAWVWYAMNTKDAYASSGQVMLAAMPIILGFQMLLQSIVLDIHNTPRVPVCARLGGSGTAEGSGART
ncbi:MAG: glycosyltransferase family 2 protein [Planctomycetota bacterium]|nr:MAG: glycosyltransferase family 2 protein [Planctomycetota bacterium]